MADVFGVLNAGSSSIKFSLFAQRDGALALTQRGQVEGLYTAPRFSAKSPDGATIAVGSSRVDLQACKLEYSIVSPK